MQVVLLRHGSPVSREAPAGPAEDARPLTEAGRAEVGAARRAPAALDVAPARIDFETVTAGGGQLVWQPEARALVALGG